MQDINQSLDGIAVTTLDNPALNSSSSYQTISEIIDKYGCNSRYTYQNILKHTSVYNGTALNYSQIYKHLRLTRYTPENDTITSFPYKKLHPTHMFLRSKRSLINKLQYNRLYNSMTRYSQYSNPDDFHKHTRYSSVVDIQNKLNAQPKHSSLAKKFTIQKAFSLSNHQKSFTMANPNPNKILLPQRSELKVTYFEESDNDLPELYPKLYVSYKRDQPTELSYQSALTSYIFPSSPIGLYDKPSQHSNHFNINAYATLESILKYIQAYLKINELRGTTLLLLIKKFIYLVLKGEIDNIEEFGLAIHRSKMVKQALLLYRVVIMMLCFAYATDSLKESVKYVNNLLTYTLASNSIIMRIFKSIKHVGEDSAGQKDDNQYRKVAMQNNQWMIKRNYDSIRNNNEVIIDSVLKLAKANDYFHYSLTYIMKNCSRIPISQIFRYLLQYFAFFLCVSDLHRTIPFLAIAPTPYLPPCVVYRYTLILDVTSVCCLGISKSTLTVFRPHSFYFLSYMSQYYEIVSWADALPCQIDKIIDLLDPLHCIKHRLYRHHTLQVPYRICYTAKGSLKPIERLGKDPSKIILIDSIRNKLDEGVNTIYMPIWKGSKNDNAMADLCPLLAMIVMKKIDCVEAVQKVRAQETKDISKGIKYKTLRGSILYKVTPTTKNL